jgi:D-glycero-alpha-D-manno-heptose-7-phosphate kinase
MAVFNEHAVRTDGSGIALVVDADQRLLGVLTDGDVRRALLGGRSLDDPIALVMSRAPTVADVDASPHELLRLFDRHIRHLPLVDRDNRVVDLVLYGQFQIAPSQRPVAIRCKAPLRISFAGGGMDFTEHFERGPCAVISATIDRYCHGTLVKRRDRRIILRSHDYDRIVEVASIGGLSYDGQLDLLKAVVRLMKPDFGFELTTWSDAPPGSGLGASAVLAVVVIGLLNELAEHRMNEYEISDLAYQAERIELGIPGGWQDQYAAAFGGLNYIEFTQREVIVHPLALRDRVVNELEESLLLCFSGQTRTSGAVHRQNGSLAPAEVERLRAVSGRLVVDIKNALVQGRLHAFATLLDEAWQAKKSLGEVTNERVEHLFRVARDAGMVGGKLLGAGQGGYLLLYCPPPRRSQVARALEAEGALALPFNFDFRGLRVWRTPTEGSPGGQ